MVKAFRNMTRATHCQRTARATGGILTSKHIDVSEWPIRCSDHKLETAAQIHFSAGL